MRDSFPTRAPSGPGWFAVLFISLVCSVASSGLLYWALANGVLPPPGARTAAPSTSPDLVKVPEVTGLPVATAGELLTARGLRLVVREQRQDARAPANTVASQEPMAESSLARGSEVNVVVSSGQAAPVLLPDLRGMTLDEARKQLDAAGLVVGPVAGPSEGVVLATQPPGGQALEKGAMVGISLELAGIEVPKLTGLYLRRAKGEIEKAGFAVGKLRERYDETKSGGIVLEQVPAAGSRAPKGTSIDLISNEDY